MPHTYILRCGNGSLYTGSTWDLERRVAEHQAGMGARHTAKYPPVELVYAEDYDRIDEAFQREKQIQGWSRSKKDALVAGTIDLLPGLAKKVFRGNVSVIRDGLDVGGKHE